MSELLLRTRRPSIVLQIDKRAALIAHGEVLPAVDAPLLPLTPVLLAPRAKSAHSELL
ncbi:MAG: hypothetical protein QXY90_04745 [Candidatus Anstonellales archaeon]